MIWNIRIIVFHVAWEKIKAQRWVFANIELYLTETAKIPAQK